MADTKEAHFQQDIIDAVVALDRLTGRSAMMVAVCTFQRFRLELP